MQQPLGGGVPTTNLELTTLRPIGTSHAHQSRAAHAVKDAHHLAAALSGHLASVSDALEKAELGERLRTQLTDTIDVCQKLTQLLGGALGSCREASLNLTPSRSVIALTPIVEAALGRVSNDADALGILVMAEGPVDLRVSVDRDLFLEALHTLLLELLGVAPPEGVIRLNYYRSGVHAVLAVTTKTRAPRRASVAPKSGTIDPISGENPRLTEVIAALSLRLLSLGGELDVEVGADGTLTVYFIVAAIPAVIEEPAQCGTGFAQAFSTEHGSDPSVGQKRSETMNVNSDRFGAIEVDTQDLLSFPTGIIGFSRENEFLLVRKNDSQVIGWLQSTRTSYLTLPVVSAHALAARYPDVPIEEFAERAGLGSNLEDLAVLGVLSAPPGQPATVNLMAPIIVNAVTRTGAQVLLEGTRFTTRELFIIPATAAAPETETRALASEALAVQAANSAAE